MGRLDNFQAASVVFSGPAETHPGVDINYRVSRATNSLDRPTTLFFKGDNTPFDLSSRKSARYNIKRSRQIRGEAVLTTGYKHEKVRGRAGGKLFRRDLTDRFRFPVGTARAEDLCFCCAVFPEAKSHYLINRNMYAHRYHEIPVTGVGAGGFNIMAREHSERYRINPVVQQYKYVHNPYLAALATRGLPDLSLLVACHSRYARTAETRPDDG